MNITSPKLVLEKEKHINTYRVDGTNRNLKTVSVTLINHYDPRSVTVVSTWQSVEDWGNWQESDERALNETQLEKMLEQPTKYEVYDVGYCQRSPENSVSFG